VIFFRKGKNNNYNQRIMFILRDFISMLAWLPPSFSSDKYRTFKVCLFSGILNGSIEGAKMQHEPEKQLNVA